MGRTGDPKNGHEYGLFEIARPVQAFSVLIDSSIISEFAPVINAWWVGLPETDTVGIVRRRVSERHAEWEFRVSVTAIWIFRVSERLGYRVNGNDWYGATASSRLGIAAAGAITWSTPNLAVDDGIGICLNRWGTAWAG